jgi:hypothetical protein
VRLIALAGRDAGDDVRAVVDHLLGVEAAFLPGKALDDQTRVVVYEYAHAISGLGLAIFEWARV